MKNKMVMIANGPRYVTPLPEFPLGEAASLCKFAFVIGAFQLDQRIGKQSLTQQ